MKKLFMVLCVVVMFFGLVGCPTEDTANTLKTSSNISSTPATAAQPAAPSPVPEPAALLLLGSGLVVLGSLGRKKFFKNDTNE